MLDLVLFRGGRGGARGQRQCQQDSKDHTHLKIQPAYSMRGILIFLCLDLPPLPAVGSGFAYIPTMG